MSRFEFDDGISDDEEQVATSIDKLIDTGMVFRDTLWDYQDVSTKQSATILSDLRDMSEKITGLPIRGVQRARGYLVDSEESSNTKKWRIMPYEAKNGLYEFWGVMRGINSVKRGGHKRNRPPTPTLVIDPLASIEDEQERAHYQATISEDQFHHPFGIYRYDVDARLWISLRGIGSLAVDVSYLEAEKDLAHDIRRILPRLVQPES